MLSVAVKVIFPDRFVCLRLGVNQFFNCTEGLRRNGSVLHLLLRLGNSFECSFHIQVQSNIVAIRVLNVDKDQRTWNFSSKVRIIFSDRFTRFIHVILNLKISDSLQALHSTAWCLRNYQPCARQWQPGSIISSGVQHRQTNFSVCVSGKTDGFLEFKRSFCVKKKRL